jgi:hypothetical protein
MSGVKRPRPDSAEPERATREFAAMPANQFKPSLKPRPLLAVVLGLLLVLWLIALVMMRLKTVAPARTPTAPSGVQSPK